MPEQKSLVVFITGCSSGIGRALAEEFARQGHQVIATARRVETLASLQAQGMHVLPLDVTDDASIAAAVTQALEEAGRIDMLINNAGFGLMGPVVELASDDLRRQLNTNVVGPVAMARALVPGMVAQGGGVIVNVGSVSGILSTPFAGAYCASKAALHALSDAMRVELAPLNVKVITLQPGGIVSRFGDNAAQALEDSLKPDSLFTDLVPFMRQRAQAGQEGAMSADEFARKVVAELTSDNPPIQLRIGTQSVRLPLTKWLLPQAMIDRVVSKKFGLDRWRKSQSAG